MRYQDYRQAIRGMEGPRPYPTLTIGSVGGICTVDGLYPLRVAYESSSVRGGTLIEVQDERQQPLGTLLTCKDEVFEVAKFGAAHLCAYLFEIEPDQYAQPGSFSSDYFLVRRERLVEYKKFFMGSSAIWGGFWHTEPTMVIASTTSAPQPITARLGIIMPTALHKEAARRSAILPYAFERYLKLYHLLELSFDHDTVEKIKRLGQDLHGIGQILSQHKRDEFERLKQLIIDKCADSSAIAKCIEDICGERKWHPTIKDIFFGFGKDGNPFLDKQTQFEQMITAPGFNEQGALNSGVISLKESKLGVFETLTLKTAAYWIYRVRCSIAHSRIGEYVMKPQDEEFVEQFAEKLLRRVLATVLR